MSLEIFLFKENAQNNNMASKDNSTIKKNNTINPVACISEFKNLRDHNRNLRFFLFVFVKLYFKTKKKEFERNRFTIRL